MPEHEHDFNDDNSAENKHLQLGVTLDDTDEDPVVLDPVHDANQVEDIWATSCTVEEAKEYLDALAAEKG